ncbi:PQQ-binding-like beta-propeller repeat protein [Streptomyces sp. 891-h]|uniref:protein kinase domain-containing protein n=1 Tax=Streptomyces sp. 891-h TaxID=2720714 RepID=UPI001FAA32FC|nr:PQQ-binding-like beta-propeller repeat protein [Streptomyces sp. 891-h]UNZ16615.1 PQQ-binding-like beta-propeller repeat protein [Streptomyces sp. 891-h]
MNPLGTGDPLRLGPYRLVGVLGVGGMGKVYLGRDGGGRAAALKVLRPELAYDAGMAQRFVREAQAASAVRSKGVARVLGAQTEGGRPWIATEFLAGPTLEEAVERHGRLAEAAVRALGAVLARTLYDIHAAGLVHRDLKPSNIVLTSGGPRVIDFGIARPEHGLTLTTTGQVPVTPGYGPPEQVLGQRVGPAADVFALGAVLAFAATGERAFTGEHVAAAQYEVVHGQPRLGGLPPGLLPLVASCLDKEAGRRPVPDRLGQELAPPRGAERVWRKGPLAEDIAERERAAKRLTALPTDGAGTNPGEARGGPSRRRLLTALAGGGALLAAGGGGAWYWLGGEESGGRNGAHEWDAEPLSDYKSGKPPNPLWGPRTVARDGGPVPLPVRDVVVVAAKGGGLHAYDVRDGRRRWKDDVSVADDGGLLAAPGERPTVLVTTSTGDVFGIGADGKDRWTAPAEAVTLLAADTDAVYLVTKGGKLRAVGLTSHRPTWTVRLPVRSTAEHPARAAVAKGRLVIHGSDGKVVGVDTANGRTVWGPRRQSAEGSALVPAIAKGVVHLGGRSLTALDLADGSEKWTEPAPGDTGWGAPALDGEVLYAASGADVEARATSDGASKWTVTLNTTTLPKDPPTVQRGTAWVAMHEDGTDGIVAVDTRKGAQAWTFVQGAAGPWRSAAAGNRVFLLQGETLTAMPVV